MGNFSATLSAPKRQISVSRPGLFSGIEDVDQAQQIVLGEARPAFQADRILDAAAELDMRAVGLARAVADPDHVRGGVVPVAAGGIDARHRLLVAEQQRFVAGVEIGACAAAAPAPA